MITTLTCLLPSLKNFEPAEPDENDITTAASQDLTRQLHSQDMETEDVELLGNRPIDHVRLDALRRQVSRPLAYPQLVLGGPQG